MTSTRTAPWAAVCRVMMMLTGLVALPVAATDPSSTSPIEVSVHIIEVFNPLRTLTMIGPYLPVYEVDGFHLMMSFKAFEFNKANAANETMACYFLDSEPDTWAPVKPSGDATAKKHDGEPAFCVSQSIPEDDKTFVVAMTKRVINLTRKPITGVLIHAMQGPKQKLLDAAKLRGWMDPPLVSFRVTKLRRWRAAPILTLLKTMQVVKADSKEQAAQQCPPDPTGAVVRKIDGGNYYAGKVGEKTVMMLCVSYVRRSLHDLDPTEIFATNVAFRDNWKLRMSTCGARFDPVFLMGTNECPIFYPRDGVESLICQIPKRLTKDLDDTKWLEDTEFHVKRAHIDESFEIGDDRMKVTYHGKHAFRFRAQDVDMDAVNKF